MKKVIGLGNALVDVLVRIHDDSILQQFDLPKGSMQLVDKEKSQKIIEALSHLKYDVASGGSAANTINGLANLGVPTGYIGKIHNDRFGEIFRKDMTQNGIEAFLLSGAQDTGIATTLISPDSQRTFGTFLGAAVELTPADLRAEFFNRYDILHVEGYLVFNHDLIEAAMKLAKSMGLKISIDLASYNVVEANLDFLKYLIEEYVDITFANEEESFAFTGKPPEHALDELSGLCEIAVVKVGARGSLVKADNERISVAAIPSTPIDTTGAGDLYAAGFLYGLSNGYDYAICGRLGSLLAGKVIEVIGTKMDDTRWSRIKSAAEKIIL